MRFRRRHRWEVSLARARGLQAELAAQVSQDTPAGFALRLIAGADMSHRRGSPWLYGAVIVLRLPSFETVEVVTARRRASFPYVPGFLSFREGPVLLDCFRRLKIAPDAVLFDAQGRAHPRRLGLASHLGLWLGLPSVGCAKSRLCGEHEPLADECGASAALTDAGERIGTVLRTRPGSRPLFISVGHRVALADAEALVVRCLDGSHRLPEPTRRAHVAVNEFRRRSEGAEIDD